MMVLISNDDLCDGNVVRSGKENGSCSTNVASVLPRKWKPRKVSAVRVFPPGCGPIMHPVNVVSQESAALSLLVSSNNEANDAVPSGKLVESTEDGKAGLIVEPFKDQMETLVNKELQNGDNQAVMEFPQGYGPIIQPVNVVSQESGVPMSLGSSNNEGNVPGPSGTLVESTEDGKDGLIAEPFKDQTETLVNEELRNGDNQAVRVFPQGCGPVDQPVNVVSQESGVPLLIITNNEANDPGPSGTLVESTEDGTVGLIVEPFKDQMETLVNKEFQNEDNKAVSKEEGSGPVNAAVQVDDVMPLSPTHMMGNGSIVIKSAKPKMKFSRRIVSGVRDFPPFCGLNAIKPTDEERMRINSRRSGGTVVDELLQKTQPVKSNDKSPMANQETGSITVKVSIGGKVGGERPSQEMIRVGEESNIDVNVGGERSSKEIIAPLTEVEPKKGLHTKPQNSNKAFTSQTHKELVVYSSEKVRKRRQSDDGDKDSEATSEDESIQNRKTSLTPTQKDFKKISGQLMKVGHENSHKRLSLDATKNLDFVEEKRGVVLGLCASPAYPLGGVEENIINKEDSTKTGKGKRNTSVTPKKSVKMNSGFGKKVVPGESVHTGTLDMAVTEDEKDFVVDTKEFPTPPKTNYVDVMPLPFGPKSSNDARNRVRETLRFFQVIYRKLLQGEEAKTSEGGESTSLVPTKRVDLAARTILIEKGKAPEVGKKGYGPVPGVEVGDEFQYRVELSLVGLHRTLQSGIDYMKQGKDLVAVSVVASGGYDNELDKPDCLTYSGSGGIGKDKQIEDQKLNKGNLALKNNIHLKIPVRVIRGYKSKPAEPSDSKSRVSVTYIYDGLYTVEDCRQETGPLGNLVFKFELKRIPGQPELALREVKSKKFKTREGICADDISGGKEVFPICAINTVDDEKPPSFHYITKIIYPPGYSPVPPKGCNCVGRCSDKRCPCAFKNGGEIPYNHNGAIVEAKPLVYECGPSCRCSPSCYNRVTQHGMKIHLEIFKTESRGWGVRSLSSITSGSFICEYIGELLEDTEAEKRTSNDEYLFDIGQNYNDCSLNPDTKPNSGEVGGTGGFTIDAANFGNVGRFVNHSCSPNLYAQNVLYDQEDTRMPHIMLFAAENIPPLQELTYHYNYAVDTVHDSDGNIKIKNCYCGSSECTGRLY